MSRPQLYLLQSYGAAIEQAALKAIDGMAQSAVVPISYENMARAAAQQPSGLVIAHVTERKDGVELVQLLKSMRSKLSSQFWMLLVVTPFKQQIFKEKLMKYGATEVLIEPVPDKNLQFKIKRLMQSVVGRAASSDSTSARGKSDANARAQSDSTKKPRWIGDGAHGPSATTSEAKVVAKIHWLPPLESNEDFFSIKGGAARYIRGRWELRLRGPLKALGEWVKVEAEQWRWEFFGQASKGAWTFFGQKPAYHQGTWVFTGPQSALSYVDSGDILLRKFYTETGHQLMMTRDSSMVGEIHQRFRETAKARNLSDGSDAPVRITREVEAQDFNLETGERKVVQTIVEEIQESIATPDEADLSALRQEVETSIKPIGPTASAEDAALDWILKREVPGPALSPLAIAFLVTEWMARPGLDHREALGRVARYLSASLGRAKVEFWTGQQGQWSRFLAHHSEGELVEAPELENLIKDSVATKDAEKPLRAVAIPATTSALVVSGGECHILPRRRT